MNTEVQKLKKCTKCGKRKPVTEEYFYRHSRCKDGFRGQCKICVNARINKSYVRKPIIIKPADHSKRDAAIYHMYYNTECNNPMKRQMLAIFYDITETELNQIIKTEDEKQMKLKWTDEKNTELLSLFNMGNNIKQLAATYGTTPHNIENRISILRKAQKPEGKPATINEDFEKEFPRSPIDSNDSYADCAPENISDIDTGEDVSGINAKIRDLCETPDPITTLQYGIDFGSKSGERTVCTPIKVETPKPDYTESLIETLREELEDNHVHWLKLNEILSEQEKTIYDQDDVIVKQNKLIIMGEPKPVPVPKQRTVFDEAHAALWSLESSAKRNGVTPVDIIIKIDPKRIIAETGSLEYGMISINKKNPLSGTAIPTSGEA